jgi:hypothetical protein
MFFDKLNIGDKVRFYPRTKDDSINSAVGTVIGTYVEDITTFFTVQWIYTNNPMYDGWIGMTTDYHTSDIKYYSYYNYIETISDKEFLVLKLKG